MPGFELIGKEEQKQLSHLMTESKILFRHGFDNLRNGIFKVLDFEEKFANKKNVDSALAVSSGTSAILTVLKAFNIKNGDEVITQAFTFVATVESIVESGAKPIICDIDKTLNLDPEKFEKNITKKTKAVIVVHMLGIPADMDRINKIAKKHNILVIEDTAWGCGGKLNNKWLGTIGDAGTFSFDFAKTMTTGEGGMVIIKNKKVFKKAQAYHDHGHENNPNLPRWKDSRSSTGFNFRMSELQGAIGLAQLEKLDSIVNSQRKNAKKIEKILNQKGFELRKKPIGSYETADAVIFMTENNKKANEYRKKLLNVGISTKILPEAITWHFAGDWDHIDSLDINKNSFNYSRKLLERSVALPVFVKMNKTFFENLNNIL